MALLRGRNVSITGTGMCVPEKTVTNDDLAKMVDTNNEWILERTGIKERHIASEGENASDFASIAASRALKSAGIDSSSIDMIVVACNSPDTIFPAVSCRVQANIGADKAGCYDLQAGCTGSVYALSTASAGIAAGLWDRVLVIGVELLSRLINWEDRNTCVLFGDGAGAVVMEASDKGKVIACDMRSDGTRSDYITLPGGMSARPASIETIEKKEHFVHMKGNDVFKFTQRILPGYLKEVCSSAGFSVDDIDKWVFHQANHRIMEGVLKRLKVDPEKSLENLEKYGNTSSASVFLVLDEAFRSKDIVPGQKVLVTSFGAGMTYGAFIFEA